MGIGLASVRHTNVVVMAPALTETGQTQSFNFSTSPSRAPSLSLKNHTLKAPHILRGALQPKLSNGVSHNTGMNGHSPISNKKIYNINGLTKNLKNEFLPLDNKNEEANDKDTSDVKAHQTPGTYIMNNTYMGDPEMGLQKSNKEICEGEKLPQEEDQIFKNLGGVMNNEELTAHPDLSNNVEDLIKAMSNLDGNTHEIESGPSGDIEHIFDNGLFNEADIINMCVDESLVAVNKDTLIQNRIEEIRKRQFQAGRKCDFLLRRLKKIQARVVGRHAAEQITGVIEYSSNLLEASRFRGSFLGDDKEIKCDVKPVSFSNMSHFMRQMENAVNQQTNTVIRNNSVRQCKYFGSGSSTNSLVSTSNGVRASLPGSVLPQYPSKVQKDLAQASGELKAQLVKIQQDIDSDVTESSSGCESCDEFINYNNAHQHPLSIGKRALWKWAEERSLIAAKWTWLQSQIADLEYKIRQHTDIKKSIRATKGIVKFIKEPVPNLPNGCNSNSEKGGESTSCSRTREFVSGSFTKRRILQIAGIHRTSKKAARATSLRCSCGSSLPGCGLCTGRAEPGQTLEPLCSLPVQQRVAHVDPGFHPILSFPQDVSATVHYNAVMKCSDWQARASRIQGKSLLQTAEDKNRVKPLPTNDHQIVDLQRSKAAALAVSVKLRRKIAKGKRRRRSAHFTLERYRHRPKPSTPAGLSGVDSEETVDQDVEVSGGSRYPSPVPSPASSHAAPVSKDKDASLKRKRENSYDIDNIVIPYSMASSTRLEKLTYKEILTPKWRLVSKESYDEVEQKNGLIRRSSHETMDVEEDTSDEAHLARHERCQVEEKKKFLSYLKLPGGLRGRAQRRTDSRADSSGPNTPDGMSPRDDGSGTTEDPPPITSPPLNPTPASTNCDNSEGAGRKRTISNSQPAPPVLPEVPPYEPRKFPLNDEAYKAMLDMNGDQQHPTIMNSSYQLGVFQQDRSVAGPPSPVSVSTDSAESFLGEDPNDPEWTTSSTAEKIKCIR